MAYARKSWDLLNGRATPLDTPAMNDLEGRIDAAHADATSDISVLREAPLNIKDDRVGAAINSSTNDTAAWTQAVAMMPSRGGEIFHPGGEFSSIVSGSFPSLFQKKNITIKGVGGQSDAGGQGSRILLTGAPADRYIDARQSVGIRFENLQIIYTNAAFTGHLLDFGNAAGQGTDTRYAAFSNCFFGGNPTSSASGAQSLLFLQNAHSIDAYKCSFMEAQVGVLGRTTNAEFSNRIGLYGCLFWNNYIAHIKNADSAWTISGSTFEGLKDGTGGMYKHDPGVVAQAVVFRDNWAGDVVVPSGPQITYSGDCLVLDGNRIGAEHVSASFISLDENNCHGIIIGGNNFVGPGGPIVQFGTTTGHTGVILPNEYDNAGPMTSGTRPPNFTVYKADGYLDTMMVGGNAAIGATPAAGVQLNAAGYADFVAPNSVSASIRTGVVGESNVRLRIGASGEMQFGPGSGGADTIFKRLGVSLLGTDTGDKLVANGGLGVGNSAAATETIGKAVTRKIEVFDASGASLGFVPVYASIT